jgi:alpha-tubulin suppressor-like RCC1 family protein
LGELGYASTATLGDDEPAGAGGELALGGQAVQISAGLHHTCAVLNNGKLRCWGYGLDGRLGYANVDNIGDDETPASAGDVDVGQSVLSVRAGGAHTCALRADLSVLCWGDAAFGELGTGKTATIGDDETPAGGGPAISELDACVGGAASCSAHATCSNTFYGFSCTCNVGYTGDGVTCDLAPAVVSIAAGAEHTCALTNLGTVRCWGAASYGRLGYPGNGTNIGDDETPKSAGEVNVGGTVTQVVAGELHTCALLSTGGVRCWGSGTQGQLGYGNTRTVGDDETPASAGDVPLGAKATVIAAGQYHSCALLQTGAVRCWGLGTAGRLGYGNTNTIGDNEAPSSAGDVPLGGAALAITAGREHTCALLSGGKVRCWGNGVNGQLGYGVVSKSIVGDDEAPSSAGDVPLGGAAIAIVAGGSRSCAIVSGGKVRCWGSGAFGGLGYGNTRSIGDDEPPSTAGDVNVGGSVVQLALGSSHSCARLDSGSVRCWGYGANGALGYASTFNVGDATTPTSAGDLQLGGSALQVSAGQNHSCAVLSSGVKCWGLGALGRLGYANTTTLGDNESPSSVGFVNLL